MKYILSTLPILTLVSCSTVIPDQVSSPPLQSKAKVVVFRSKRLDAPLHKHRVALNGKSVGHIQGKSFIAMDIPSGAHSISVSFKKTSSLAGYTTAKHNFKIRRGETVYLEHSASSYILTEAPTWSGTASAPVLAGADYTMIGKLTLVDRATAIAKLAGAKEGIKK